MPVTSDSAKIKFYTGSFDYNTTLTLPATTTSNKLTLRFDEFISDQLAGWGSAPFEIYGLLRVSFEGEVIYTNDEFSNTSEDYPPESPDITITPNTSPATAETVAVNYYVPMVTGTDGNASSGTYTVEIEFVYWASDILYETEDATTFTANFVYERNEPEVSEWYDQELPSLTIVDLQDYTINGVTATTNTEFVLSPPQNRAEITNTYEDIQTVTYSSFWTGSNEMTYTALIEYEFTNYVTVQAEQEYYPFTVYYMDWCATYECLNELYNLAIGANCGTKQKAVYEDRWAQATSLIQQIQLGLGCGKSTISGLITQLNDVLDCSCGCLDDTPRQINSSNVVPDSEIQIVNTSSTETEIDLSAGSTVIVNIDVSGDTTELQFSNITQYANYRLVLVNDSQELIQSATFESTVRDTLGTLEDADVGSFPIIIDLFATTTTIMNLVSRSDA